MAAKPTIRSALLYVGQSSGLSKADRDHLNRWLDEVRSPVWEQIAADVESHGEMGNFIEGPYSVLIGYALRARVFATESSSTWLTRKWAQQNKKQERADLIALAEEMEKVVRRYQNCKPAQPPPVPPSPDDEPSAPPPAPEQRELEAKRSLAWFASEAQRLRELAEREPRAGEDWFCRVPQHISRQNGGKGKDKQSRQLGAFCREMVNWLYLYCDRPNYRAVALMVNISFPEANVDAEGVRLFCKPTTRVGRRRKAGTPRQ
jgi:hypothetical protein